MPYGLSLRAIAHVLQLRRGVREGLAEIVRQWPEHANLAAAALTGGRRNRPMACMLACETVGGRWPDARPFGLAVELGHKASVILDDVADEDTVRRGRPTFHAVHGIPVAIAVSDALWTAALALVADRVTTSAGRLDQCLALFVYGFHDMAMGQLHDVEVSRSVRHSVTSRLRVNGLKTGALLVLALRVGAIVGGGTHREIEALSKFGQLIGTAFQVLNDVNNLLGREAHHGRSAGTDIEVRRHTPLLAYAIERAGPAGRLTELADSTSPLTPDQVREMRRILISIDAPEYGEKLAREMLDEARQCLSVLRPTLARTILLAIASRRSFRSMVS